MIYLVPKGSKKYDNNGNEGRGWYRNFVVKIVPTDLDRLYPCYIRHSETFYDLDGWESDFDIVLVASEFNEEYYEEVSAKECYNYEPPYNLLFFESRIKYVKNFSEAEEIHKKETSLEEKWGWLTEDIEDSGLKLDTQQMLENSYNEMINSGFGSETIDRLKENGVILLPRIKK